MRNRIMVGLASTALVAGMAAIPAAAGEEKGSARLSGDAGTESQAAAGANGALGGQLLSHLLLRLTAENDIAAKSTTPACGEVGDVADATDSQAEAAGTASAGAGDEVDAEGTLEADASAAGDVDVAVESHTSTAIEGTVDGGPRAAADAGGEADGDANAEIDGETETDAGMEDSDLSISTGGEADLGVSFELGSG